MPAKDEAASIRASLLTRLSAGHAITAGEILLLLRDPEAYGGLAEVLADYAEFRRLRPKWVTTCNYVQDYLSGADDFDRGQARKMIDSMIEELEGTTNG